MKKLWLGAGAAAIAAVVAIILVLPGDSTEPGNVRLRVLKEAVEVKAGDASAFTKATTGMPIAARTHLRTSSTGQAQLDYWDGSLTRLGPSTEYSLDVISRKAGQRLAEGKLDIGKTFHNVKKVTTSGSRFEVRTANAVAAVRGTRFAVICPVRDACTIAVKDGSVLVTGKDGDVVLVGAGQEVTVDKAGNLSPLRPISPESQAFIEENVTIDALQAEESSGGSTSTTVTDQAGPPETTPTTGPPDSTPGNPGPGSPPSSTPGNGPPGDVPRGGGGDTTTTTRAGYPPRPPGP